MIKRKSEQYASRFSVGIADVCGHRLWLSGLVFLTALFLATSTGRTQDSGAIDQENSAREKIAELEAQIEQLQDATVSLITASRGLVSGSQDPRRQEIDNKYYELWAAHNLNVFKWTVWESRILLAVVLSVVTCGLYFAYIQLRSSTFDGSQTEKGNKKGSKGIATGQTAPSGSGDTALEFSLSSVKITSSIVGLVILALSLAFFYLYLTEVYPLKIVSPNGV